MNAYSTLKAGWHLDRIQGMREGRNIVPVELQLILSDYCNHDCFFCAYRASGGLSTERFAENGEKNPNRMIAKSKALEILNDAAEAGIKSVIFTGGGEPSAHPNHMEIFKAALDLGLECSLNTNGVIFREGWEEVLPRFTYVRFSVDAATASEYAEVRKCPEGHYMKMLKNLTDLSAEVKEQGSACVVGTGYVVTEGNWRLLRQGIRNLRDTGAHYVRIAAMQSTSDKEGYNGAWDDALEKANSCEDMALDHFAVYNLMDGVVGERPDYSFCGFQHMVLYVGANLECYRCCYTAYTDIGLVGSLKDKRLADYLKERDLTFDAKDCRVCPLNEKNRTIDYLTQKEPPHVNFV